MTVFCATKYRKCPQTVIVTWSCSRWGESVGRLVETEPECWWPNELSEKRDVVRYSATNPVSRRQKNKWRQSVWSNQQCRRERKNDQKDAASTKTSWRSERRCGRSGIRRRVDLNRCGSSWRRQRRRRVHTSRFKNKLTNDDGWTKENAPVETEESVQKSKKMMSRTKWSSSRATRQRVTKCELKQ